MGNNPSIAYPYSSRQLYDQGSRSYSYQPEDAPVHISQQEFNQLFKSCNQNTDWERGPSQPTRRVIDKVSAQLRMKEQHPRNHVSVYDPMLVPLGPYHHGNNKFQQAMEFKYLSLDLCCTGSDRQKKSAYEQILGKIRKVRECYVDEEILNKYDDKQLAFMMLLDSCFILNFMETLAKSRRNNLTSSRNQAAADPFMARDILVLENQIPLFVLMTLINTFYDQAGGIHILKTFFNWILRDKLDDQVVAMFHQPQADQNLPLHILEACWKLIAGDNGQAPQKGNDTAAGTQNQHILPVNYLHTESATELQSKGIHFTSTSSCFLNEINFEPRLIYGQLKVPTCYVSEQTRVMLSNMIAYELSPNTENKLVVLSYTQFMKSVIQTTGDVKILQQKGVFHRNVFAYPEQVVKFYKGINTLGMGNSEVYEDVISKIGEHSSRKGSTWLAEVAHEYLRSPWTIIGLLAATLLLVLTILQTYYTIYPVN